MDFKQQTLDELEDLRDQIDSEIQSRKNQKKNDALRQIKDIAEQAGLSPDELLNLMSKKTRTSAGIKYRNPDNSEQAWSGRGRRPRWLEEGLKKGKTLDDYLV